MRSTYTFFMKHILRYFLWIPFCFLLLQGAVFAADEMCGAQSGKALYDCRVQNVCDAFKSEKPVYNSEEFKDYPEIQSWNGGLINANGFEQAKVMYRKNIGNIYKCAIIQAQKNALNKLQDFVKQESTGDLNDVIGRQMQQRFNRLEITAGGINCTLADTDSIQNKLNILRETSHQACKYVSFLEYSKKYYQNFNNIRNVENTNTNENYTPKYPNQELPARINKMEQQIAEEIAHTYKVFPIAFQAYSEYENNFPIHFMLEILRGDFIVYRNVLYKSLMPLAQLGLKVINAMSY